MNGCDRMSDSHQKVLQTRLSNGLEVRLKEIHTAPLISNWIWYRVGSRNERPGLTGISHWVEHMQFKGTEEFPEGVLDRMISRNGGIWNAFTHLDFTAFMEVMPADQIDLALRLEADRMANSLFKPEEVNSERTVIISERQGQENQPTFRLAEKVKAAAYQSHPYHHEVIGEMADLKRITRDNLYAHYRSYYVPSNAILALAGDFECQAMLDRIRELYEPLTSRPKMDFLAQIEPPQQRERRVKVNGPGETSYLEVAYHAPRGSDPDFMALTVLDSVLTGASGLRVMGGGLSNKTSRLYHALVEGEIAAAVSGSLSTTVDPYLYGIWVTVRPDQTPEKALDVLDGEISRLIDRPVAAEEVAKSIKQARALFAYGSESITNQAFWLGYSEMFADYSWFEEYLDRIAEISPEDVHAVAQKYLNPANRVVGIYQPVTEKAHV